MRDRDSGAKPFWRRRLRTPTALALLSVVAVSLAAGALVFLELVLLRQSPEWDEAAHSLQGALIAHDVRAGALRALLFDTYRQIYWPPLHSWLVGAAFLVTGPSLDAARAVSVVCYALVAPVLFLTARIVAPRHGILAGGLAAGLALTSPGIVALAAMSMLELPGLLALCGAMLAYCVLERDPDARPLAQAWIGIAVVLTYLVKTNYGILLILAILLDRFRTAGFRLRPLLTRRNLWAALPVILFGAAWFAYPQKVVWTWNALVNTPWGGEAAEGWAGLLFFPRALADLSGGGLQAGLLWAGLLLAWRTRDRPGVPFLALLALLQFVIGELHHTKIERHILPMLPPMFVLTGVAAGDLWGRLRGRARRRAIAAAAAVGCLALLQFRALSTHDWKWDPCPGDAVGRFVAERAREGEPSLILGTTRACPRPPVLDWQLVAAGTLPVTRAGAATNFVLFWRLRSEIRDPQVPEPVRRTVRFLVDRYHRPSALRSLHADDWGPGSWRRFHILLESTLRRDPPRTVVVMVGDSTSHSMDDVASVLVEGGYRESCQREFPAAGTRVAVFRRSRDMVGAEGFEPPTPCL